MLINTFLSFLLKGLPAGRWPESESDLGPLVSQIQAAQDECTGAGQYLHVPTLNRHKGETTFELEQRSLKVEVKVIQSSNPFPTPNQSVAWFFFFTKLITFVIFKL